MEGFVMGSKRLTPSRMGKMASKCLSLLLLFWQISELVPIYKGKGDVMECSLSRGIKLLEHGM